MAGFDGEAYQARFDALAAKGADVHGEATLVASFAPRTVLDAGCGTGRVGIELARRGIDVVGVDIDAGMLDMARRLAPQLEWVEADLATFALGRRFDVVVLAGNVLLFTTPGTEGAVVARCAVHVEPRGALVAGFSLRPGGYGVADLDRDASAVGLTVAERRATWDGAPWRAGGDYAVTVLRPG